MSTRLLIDQRSLCPSRLSSPCVDDAVIRVYDEAGNVIETHEHAGDFIAPIQLPARKSTLSETIRQRPMRAGCWRFLHANDDKVTACGFWNDVRSRKAVSYTHLTLPTS